MSYEAFVYQWYDSKNRMFYLGYHKGTPDDGYTHSSTIMESFKSNEVPPYMKRRILAYGTHEEMCELEYELLKNRKAKCWDRYYNESLGDPRVVDTSGENHYNYKHGLSYDKKHLKEYNAKWYRENKEHVSEYLEKTKEHRQAYARRYYYENIERQRESQKKWIEENIEHHREYQKKYKRKWRAKKKLEKEQANSVSLDMFFV